MSCGPLPPAEALPDRGVPPLSRVATVVRERIAAAVWPPVAPGEGFLSETRAAIRQLDLVNGFDQTLGKRQTIQPGPRQAQGRKIFGNLSTREALGPLTGALPRMYA